MKILGYQALYYGFKLWERGERFCWRNLGLPKSYKLVCEIHEKYVPELYQEISDKISKLKMEK